MLIKFRFSWSSFKVAWKNANETDGRVELINFSLDRTLKTIRETMLNSLAQEKKNNDLLFRLIRLFLHG